MCDNNCFNCANRSTQPDTIKLHLQDTALIDPVAVRRVAGNAAALIAANNGNAPIGVYDALILMKDHLDKVLPSIVRSTKNEGGDPEDEDDETEGVKYNPVAEDEYDTTFCVLCILDDLSDEGPKVDTPSEYRISQLTDLLQESQRTVAKLIDVINNLVAPQAMVVKAGSVAPEELNYTL